MGKPKRQNKSWSRIMLDVLITAAVFYVAVMVLMYTLQRQFMYVPANFTPSPSESGVAEMTPVVNTTADGLDITSWYAPPSDPSKPVVALFHGNAGTIGSRGFKARVFLDAGYGVMLVGYRAYSGNPGEPSEAGLMADAHAALAFLAGQGFAGDGIVLYGESLGTGVATAMAAEAARSAHPVRALILEAPFTSAVDAARSHYPFLPVGLLLKDRYDSAARITHIDTPLLVVHGDQDWTIPQRLGRKLYAAAVPPKQAVWIDGAGHNDLFEYAAGVRMLEFLAPLNTRP